MKNIIAATAIVFALPAWSQSSPHHKSIFLTGGIVNQVIIDKDIAYVIDSGTFDNEGNPAISPRISRVNLKNRTKINTTKFLKGLNLYRGAIDRQSLFVSVFNDGTLLQVDTNKELNQSQISSKRPFYKAPRGSYGMESVVKMRDKVLLTYSNSSGVNTYLDGEVAVLKKQNGRLIRSHKLITPKKNPKYMIDLGGGKVAVATGSYGKNEGQILIIDTNFLPQTNAQTSAGRVDLRSYLGTRLVQAIDVRGTPSNMFHDRQAGELFVCDLEESQKRFLKVNLKTLKVTSYSGQLDSCGAVTANRNYVFATNFYGGLPSYSKKHLYVYNRQTGREVCSLVLKLGRLTGSYPLFPNNLAVYKNRDLLVAYGATKAAYLSFLTLDAKGLPKECSLR